LNASFFSSFTLQDPIEIPVRLLRGNARAVSKTCHCISIRLPGLAVEIAAQRPDAKYRNFVASTASSRPAGLISVAKPAPEGQAADLIEFPMELRKILVRLCIGSGAVCRTPTAAR
jgi:hypothetical protein